MMCDEKYDMISSLIHSYFKFVLSLHEVLGITNVMET